MYALEKRLRGGVWRRCAICGNRKPLVKVAAGLNDTRIWRVAAIPDAASIIAAYAHAA